ncbi:hypothetical protein KP509_29G010200 [Ceratopteris richardii]|uniref:Uncharacterized protein n=1 Tax=Ceratopteris richardii TaxID=49495 RepID=A0A8T2R4N5_CERRI|nr:hypothetical protein KP509_29G010200 [Ceratopteris richardii]
MCWLSAKACFIYAIRRPSRPFLVCTGRSFLLCFVPPNLFRLYRLLFRVFPSLGRRWAPVIKECRLSDAVEGFLKMLGKRRARTIILSRKKAVREEGPSCLGKRKYNKCGRMQTLKLINRYKSHGLPVVASKNSLPHRSSMH